MAEIRRASAWEIRLSHSFGVLRLRSLRERIIAFAMLAALVPSLITAYLAYGQSRRSLDARLGDERSDDLSLRAPDRRSAGHADQNADMPWARARRP